MSKRVTKVFRLTPSSVVPFDPGYVFKKGPKGVGYYLDKKPQPKFQPNLKKQPAKQQQQGQPGGWVKMKGGLKYQDMKPGRCVTLAQAPARDAKWVPGFA